MKELLQDKEVTVYLVDNTSLYGLITNVEQGFVTLQSGVLINAIPLTSVVRFQFNPSQSDEENVPPIYNPSYTPKW